MSRHENREARRHESATSGPARVSAVHRGSRDRDRMRASTASALPSPDSGVILARDGRERNCGGSSLGNLPVRRPRTRFLVRRLRTRGLLSRASSPGSFTEEGSPCGSFS